MRAFRPYLMSSTAVIAPPVDPPPEGEISPASLASALKLRASYDAAYEPALAASPPTITQNAAATWSTTNRKFITEIPNGFSGLFGNARKWINAHKPEVDLNLTYARGPAVVWQFEGTGFEFNNNTSAGTLHRVCFRLGTSGPWTWATGAAVAPTGGTSGLYWTKYDMPADATWQVQLIGDEGNLTSEIRFNRTAAAANVQPVNLDEPKIFVTGDSYLFVQGVSEAAKGYPRRLARYMGCREIWANGLRQNGIDEYPWPTASAADIAAGHPERTSIQPDFHERLDRASNPELTAPGPVDLVVAPVSINDLGPGHSYATVYPKALLYFQKLRIGQPDALIVVPFMYKPPNYDATAFYYAAIKDAWRDSGRQADPVAFLLDNVANGEMDRYVVAGADPGYTAPDLDHPNDLGADRNALDTADNAVIVLCDRIIAAAGGGGGGGGAPANALLAEDGTPLLAEDGSYLLTEA